MMPQPGCAQVAAEPSGWSSASWILGTAALGIALAAGTPGVVLYALIMILLSASGFHTP
jgi:hypothetical protein